jgi:hypothetical protein
MNENLTSHASVPDYLLLPDTKLSVRDGYGYGYVEPEAFERRA